MQVGNKNKTDAELAAALLELAQSSQRSDILAQLATSVAAPILIAAFDSRRVDLDLIEDEQGNVDERALVECFLKSIQPIHDAHDYLGDWWYFVWDYAWQDGIAEVVLGSTAGDASAAENLLSTVCELADKAGCTEDPPFTEDDFRVFISDWRWKFVRELAALMK